MPLYEYNCDGCGPFDIWRSLSESNLPVVCTTCQAPAKKIFSPPMVLSTGMSGIRRKGASEEPRLVVRDASREPPPPKPQSQPGGRPWMVNH